MARDIIRQIGVGRFVLEIPPWLVRRTYLFYAAVPRPRIGSQRPDLPLRLEALNENAVDALVALRPSLYSNTQISERLREGHLAFLGRIDGAIVHARWIFVGSVHLPYLGHRLVLGPGEGYLDEVFTVPAWRHRGVEFAAAVAMHAVLHTSGFRRILCSIASWNRPPQRVAEKLGYEIVGACGYWNVLGYKKSFQSGAVVNGGDGRLRVEAVPAGASACD
jgi:RimJ/RimL family protein N-acetyltransferase